MLISLPILPEHIAAGERKSITRNPIILAFNAIGIPQNNITVSPECICFFYFPKDENTMLFIGDIETPKALSQWLMQFNEGLVLTTDSFNFELELPDYLPKYGISPKEEVKIQPILEEEIEISKPKSKRKKKENATIEAN